MWLQLAGSLTGDKRISYGLPHVSGASVGIVGMTDPLSLRDLSSGLFHMMAG